MLVHHLFLRYSPSTASNLSRLSGFAAVGCPSEPSFVANSFHPTKRCFGKRRPISL